MKKCKLFLAVSIVVCLGFVLTSCLNVDEPITAYTLTLEVDGTGDVLPGLGEQLYFAGTKVVLEATRLSLAWSFSEWEGDVADSDRKITLVDMDEDKTITAVFSQDEIRDVVTRSTIMGFEGVMSEDIIDNNEDDKIPVGTLFYYKTTEGNYGKMQVMQNDYGSHGWVINFITFNNDGTIKLSVEGAGIRGTYSFNLDGDEGDPDFRLRNKTHVEREFRPQNGAKFYMVP